MSVFIVDDNEDITEFLSYLISGLDLHVHAFNHPIEALTCMRQHNLMPQLLITDYNLPAINGVELHRQMKVHIPALQTVEISGRNAQPDVGELVFMQKPFLPEQMVAYITSIMAKSGGL